MLVDIYSRDLKDVQFEESLQETKLPICCINEPYELRYLIFVTRGSCQFIRSFDLWYSLHPQRPAVTLYV
jgi:hypothetical protein